MKQPSAMEISARRLANPANSPLRRHSAPKPSRPLPKHQQRLRSHHRYARPPSSPTERKWCGQVTRATHSEVAAPLATHARKGADRPICHRNPSCLRRSAELRVRPLYARNPPLGRRALEPYCLLLPPIDRSPRRPRSGKQPNKPMAPSGDTA